MSSCGASRVEALLSALFMHHGPSPWFQFLLYYTGKLPGLYGHLTYRARARTSARVTPAISMRFLGLFWPPIILRAEIGTFKRLPRSRRSASFARSSTGGAVTRTLSAP